MQDILRATALAALVATASAVQPLHAQDPHAALDRLRDLTLDSIVSTSTVYFRPADRERALALQSMLDEFLDFWNPRLGLNAHVRVAVLSPDDWQQLTPLPYGFPNNIGPPANLILAPSAPAPPTDLDTLLMDRTHDGRDWLVIGHEGGHLLNWALLPARVLDYANDRTQTDTAAERQLRRVDRIPKWFWEYSSNFFLTAFLEARHPISAAAWNRYLEAYARPPAPRYSHLDEWFGEFMRATAADGSPYFLSAEGGRNFGWYQGVAGLLGAHVIAEGGDGVAHIRRTIAGDDTPSTASLLAEMESMAPGTMALVERLGVGYGERDTEPGPGDGGRNRAPDNAAAPEACPHLPRVAAPAALPNDNRIRAGTLRDGTLTLRLEARAVAWHPEGPDGCGVHMHAFAETDEPATIPGPLIRVRAGTQVHVTVRNDLGETIHVRGLHDRVVDSLEVTSVQPGDVHEFRFTATVPGTFYYWADRREGASTPAANEDGQLVGALIVDAPDAEIDDRVFVLTRWRVDRAVGEPPFELNAFNGLSWPHTERLSLIAGEPVRWRVINATNDDHLMHLHGSYFRVLTLGDATRNDAFRRVRRSHIVTEGLAPGWTMQLEWTPARAGNWIFHCHVMAHMAPHQRLDRMLGAPTLVAAAHTGHAEHDMAGLVMGITVSERRAAAVSSTWAPQRRLHLFANSRAHVFGARPGMGFVVQEGAAPPARDSIRIPGSPLILTRGEPVEIVVHNRLDQPLAVHWHGLELDSGFDGVAGWSGAVGSIAPAIAPGDSFVVRLTPPRAGTFMYHVHNEHGEELASGLYGPLLVLEPGQRYDAGRDLVFVVADAGPGGLRGTGRPPFINGTTSPSPLELVQGETYRFRFIHITANDAQQVTLQGPGEIAWRALARDGADYAPRHATRHPPRNGAGPGTTFDFEFVPQASGHFVLSIANFVAGTAPGTPTVVPIRVRERLY